MSKTDENLKAAFAGESQANRKYLAYAKKAEVDGLPGIAKLFRAAAAAETVHAHKHLTVMNGIKSTGENLLDAIAGETHEFKSMYPQMIADAEEEARKQAIITFRYANEVEKVHAQLYEEAKKLMGDYPEKDYYICRVCGYTITDEAPDKCPVCGARKEYFYLSE